ncbi:pyridoxal 5'-phosphate synthase glutaminase subunit PdxT [Thermodesulfobacteriota bacterium]
MIIGVLALQGAFEEHVVMLRRLGVEAREIRLPEQLEDIDGLILPGGESTTFAKLALGYGLMEPLTKAAESMPMWGTCAGMVFMARDVGMDQPVLGILDITVHRNAFGRQVDSFEAELEVKGLEGEPFHGIFIRAPEVKAVGESVEVICRLQDGRIVGVRSGPLVATSFHPELTRDPRIHRYFLDIVKQESGGSR